MDQVHHFITRGRTVCFFLSQEIEVVLIIYFCTFPRRKAFWVAKQILQLGMGDALDDWVLEKIRLLRRGTVVASGIQRVEQVRKALSFAQSQ